jgi:hypothetical protein
MDLSTSRSAARLAVPVLLALLAGGCGGDSPSTTAAPATTTTAAPTTTTVPPLNAKELAWLKGVSAVRTKVENSFQAKGSVSLTRAIVLEYNSQLASWSRQLRRLGTPPIASSRPIRSSGRPSRPSTRARTATPGRLVSSAPAARWTPAWRHGCSRRRSTAAMPPRGMAPTCSTRPTPRARSSRPSTADKLAVALRTAHLSSVWKVRPVPRWPSCRCRREHGRRRRPPAGPALKTRMGKVLTAASGGLDRPLRRSIHRASSRH